MKGERADNFDYVGEHKKRMDNIQKAKETDALGAPISAEQIKRQLDWIDKNNQVRKSDFILETNSQKVIEAYYKLNPKKE